MMHSNQLRARRAASLLEVTGCVLAVVVGVWLGAQYLGLNLHAAAYTALTETEMMDTLPESMRLSPPPGMQPLSTEEQAVALNAELEALRKELAQLNQADGAPVSPLALEADIALQPELLERRKVTLAFWSQLGGIRDEVDRLQAQADQAVNEQNVYKVLDFRRRAYAYGAKAVQQSLSEAVDPQARQFAEQLIGWYEGGARLYSDAMHLWQSQQSTKGGVPTDRLLQNIRQQHDNEAMLLFQKGGRLCEVLFRRYKVAFPEIENSARAEN